VTAPALDAVVAGAGFAGLYAIHRLRAMGLRVQAFEAGGDVGGTWYWNRYPGARCDVESLDYSYSFSEELQQEWEWTEKYAGQPEILRYLRHVAERFGLRGAVQFGTSVTAARFDPGRSSWQLETDRGDRVEARFFILAGGCLSRPQLAALPGLQAFAGRVLHTGRWPHEPVDFGGRRVAVIGTGSSGIQLIPQVARQAAQLTVFQRTPNYSLPAFNRPLDRDYVRWFKRHYAQRREKARYAPGGSSGYTAPDRSALDDTPREREAVYERGWARGSTALLRSYKDILTSQAANDTLAQFVRAKIRGKVRDPAVAALLAPTDHGIGTKRVCLDTGYFEAYDAPHVRLVNLREEPLVEVTPGALRTRAREVAVDDLVFATGYDAISGAALAIDLAVEGGPALADHWRDGARACLGLMAAGFPNLFLVTGPGSPSVLANMVTGIEQHVDWIAGCIAYLRERGAGRIEATAAAEQDWMAHVQRLAAATLLPRANSWFTGANIPGKPRVFLPYVGGHGAYRMACADVAFRGYEGFTIS